MQKTRKVDLCFDQVSEALIRQKSCFLDESIWRDVLAIPVHSSESYPKTLSLIASSASLAALASFRKDVYQFNSLQHPDVRLATLKQLLVRAHDQRKELKEGLSRTMAADGRSAEDDDSVIFTKNALTLICVDATLIDLLKFSSDIPEDQDMADLKPQPDNLHIEISETFKHVFVKLEIANKEMPVETAQLLLVVRKLSSDMLSKYGHPRHRHLWARLEETVNRIDGDSTRGFCSQHYQL